MPTDEVYADQSTIAVAVNKGKSSQAALKWAIEELHSQGQTITLVHVRDTYAMEADLGDFFHYGLDVDPDSLFLLGEGGWNPGAALKGEIEKKTRTKLEPFHAFCMRRKIESKEVVIDEKDVPKAISEYIGFTEISTLVIGARSRKGFFKKFRGSDTADKITAAMPAFCSVYVVSEGKFKLTLKGTSTSSPPEQAIETSTMASNSIEDGKDIGCRDNYSFRSSAPGGSDLSGVSTNFKTSGFTSTPSTSGMSGSTSSLSDISFTSSSTIKHPYNGFSDRSSSSFSTGCGCSNCSCNSMLCTSFRADSDVLSQSNADMMDTEVRKLRLELKKKVESYNAACNGTLAAPQEVSDSNNVRKWREEGTISQTNRELANKGNNSVARLENDKYRAGILAVIEAQQRRIARMKETCNVEENMQLLTKLGQRLRLLS